MESLRNKIDHKNFMCNHVEWRTELCKQISLENFKLPRDNKKNINQLQQTITSKTINLYYARQQCI